MSSRNQRVSSGINSLVRRLLVEIPGEDPASTEERENNAVDFVTEVLQRYIQPSNSRNTETDSNLQLARSSCYCRCQPSIRPDQEAIITDESESRQSPSIYEPLQQAALHPINQSKMGSSILFVPTQRPPAEDLACSYQPFQKPCQKWKKAEESRE